MPYLAVLGASRGRIPGFTALLGVALGLAFLGIAVGLGAGSLILNNRVAYESLRWAGAVYLCWLLPTEYGKPFTVNGYSGFMRDAIRESGNGIGCRPHGLRKTFGRLLVDAGAMAHEIMAALGHLTLAEAERYTREADRRRGGRRAILKLDGRPLRNRIERDWTCEGSR